MKNVMTRAWEIAKDGAAKFGGSVKEYFAQALVIAWSEIKKGVAKMEKVIFETSTGSRKHKAWVAKITGAHSTYKFEREFLNEKENDGYNKFFELEEGGVYDVATDGQRYYIAVQNGEVVDIDEDEIAGLLA